MPIKDDNIKDDFSAWLSTNEILLVMKQLEYNCPWFKFAGIVTYEDFEIPSSKIGLSYLTSLLTQNRDKEVFGYTINVCHNHSSG